MLVDISLAVLIGICQFVTAWLGWRVTLNPIDPNDPKQKKRRRVYQSLFIAAGLSGIALIALTAYRLPRDRAHLSFGIFPTWGGPNASWASGPVDHRAGFLHVNEPLSFNVLYTNVGPGVSANIAYRKAAFIEPDISTTSENDVIGHFEKMRASEPLEGATTLSKDDKAWITVHGAILAPEDYDNLVYGRRVAYLIVELAYYDDSGDHIRHFCTALAPPQPGGIMIWDYCGKFNDER